MTVEQEMMDATTKMTRLVDGMTKQEIEVLHILDEAEIYDVTTEPSCFVHLARAELTKSIAQLMPRWVSVEDGLPEEDGEYDVMRNGKRTILRYDSGTKHGWLLGGGLVTVWLNNCPELSEVET